MEPLIKESALFEKSAFEDVKPIYIARASRDPKTNTKVRSDKSNDIYVID